MDDIAPHYDLASVFSEYTKRLSTFDGWTGPVNKEDLANDGFVWMKIETRVMCVFCRGVLSDWEFGQSVNSEHRRYCPECPMTYDRDTPVPPTLTTGAKYPQWACPKLRLRSYIGWYKSQLPLELANSGFVFMNAADRVKCYYCGVELYEWDEEDDPWVEHAKWFPTCNYVRTIKGDDWVETIRNCTDLVELENVTMLSSPAVRIVLNEGNYSKEEIREILRLGRNFNDDYLSLVAALENNRDIRKKTKEEAPPDSTMCTSDEDRVMCKICFDNPLQITFVPCGHFSTCSDCATRVVNCPICRKHIRDKVKTHMS